MTLAPTLAAGEGFEPSQTESESVVLPLHNPAIFCPRRRDECYYNKQFQIVKSIFKFFLRSAVLSPWTAERSLVQAYFLWRYRMASTYP